MCQQQQQQRPERRTRNEAKYKEEDFEVIGSRWYLLPQPVADPPNGKKWRYIGHRIRSADKWVNVHYNTTPPTTTTKPVPWRALLQVAFGQAAAPEARMYGEDHIVVGGIWAELPEPKRPAPEGKTWRFIGTRSSTGPWVQCLYNTTPPTCRPVRRAEPTPEEEPTSEEAAAENTEEVAE